MHSSFFRAVCQAGIFVICAQTITHFKPNRSYEKYFKLLVSVMILIQVFRPVSSLFSGGEGTVESRAEQFRELLEQNMEQSAEDAARAEQILEKMTLLEIQKMIAEEKEREAVLESGMEEAVLQDTERYGRMDGEQEDAGTGNAEGADGLGDTRKSVIKEIRPVEKIKVGLEQGGGTHEGDMETMAE